MSHAQTRALERYNIRLDSADFQEMMRQVRDGEAIKLQRLGGRKSIYICWAQGEPMIVVYNRSKKFFITVLPWADADAFGYEVLQDDAL